MRTLSVFLIVWAGLVEAAPDTSKRPIARDTGIVLLEPSGSIAARPRDAVAQAAAQRGQSVALSLRPKLRPRKFRKIARAQEKLRAKGAVCSDPDIQGEPIGRVSSDRQGCGVPQAVRIRSVSGVVLSQRAVMDCNTAKALKSWVDDTAKPTYSKTGGGLKSLRVVAHYACRTRNSRAGARISEHGKGRAIDISAVGLRDGTLITVLNGWRNAKTGAGLRRLHKGACGPFGTVLGPESDRFHQDHFHFDTARYRSGPYCR